MVGNYSSRWTHHMNENLSEIYQKDRNDLTFLLEVFIICCVPPFESKCIFRHIKGSTPMQIFFPVSDPSPDSIKRTVVIWLFYWKVLLCVPSFWIKFIFRHIQRLHSDGFISWLFRARVYQYAIIEVLTEPISRSHCF